MCQAIPYKERDPAPCESRQPSDASNLPRNRRILDQGDDPHGAFAQRALQPIGLVDFADHSLPSEPLREPKIQSVPH